MQAPVGAVLVYGGPDAGHLRPVVSKVPKFGFETVMALPRGPATFEVEALDTSGRVIGTSKPFGVSG